MDKEKKGQMKNCKDGMIGLDSKMGNQLGFTSDKFDGWMWKNEDCIYISFIESKDEGKGNLSRLFDNIVEQGYTIKVPTPMGRMISILTKKGFKRTTEPADEFGENETCEVWVLSKK